MYSSIRIQGYRGLDSFRLCGLGRVNLLVGTNNCGKTSILECIELLRSAGHPSVLSAIAARRGEWTRAGAGDARGTPVPRSNLVDVSHLFANRGLENPIRIEAERAGGADPAAWNDRVTVCVQAPSPSEHDERGPEPAAAEEDDDDARLVLRVKWSDAQDDHRAPVTDEGLLPVSRLRRPLHLGRALRLGRWRNLARQPVRFVTTTGVTAADVAETLSEFVLTPKEEAVTRALRIVEPAIERIAPVDPGRHNRDAPGGVVLKLRDVPDDSNALYKLARKCAAEAGGKGAPFRDAHERKAEIFTWLAWGDPPGLRLHEAVKHRVLDPKRPESRPFVNWFRRLFRV